MKVTVMRRAIAACWLFVTASAISLDITSKLSVCAAAKLVQVGIWNYYEGTTYGGTVGMFVPPYYWWNAGQAFGGLLDYYAFCDPTNDTLKNLIYEGMYHQAGSNFDFIPANQTMVEGNDDQGVWGLTIMQAVERNFTDPPQHSWLSMAQAIYNTMNSRWDDKTCGGGLRWQMFTWNAGYDYKNTIANGCLFQMAARLARFVGNDSNGTVTNYTDTVEKVWDWMIDVGFMTLEDDGTELQLYDGAKINPTNQSCDYVTHLKWSYNFGVFITGAAYMYNFTQDAKWKTRIDELWTASKYFFPNKIMTETTCATNNKCNNDQRTFRCLFARSLSLVSVLVPEMRSEFDPYMQTSASAAAQSCSGGTDGITCGFNWAFTGWDGQYGLGEQMSALETIQYLIYPDFPAPYTSTNGGSSQSVPDAGLNIGTNQLNTNLLDIKAKDRAGAGVLTAVVLALILGCSVWMIF